MKTENDPTETPDVGLRKSSASAVLVFPRGREITLHVHSCLAVQLQADISQIPDMGCKYFLTRSDRGGCQRGTVSPSEELEFFGAGAQQRKTGQTGRNRPS